MTPILINGLKALSQKGENQENKKKSFKLKLQSKSGVKAN